MFAKVLSLEIATLHDIDNHPDLRQCLIYDSCAANARLIGVEYMIPRDKWDALETEAMQEVVHLYGKLYHFWEVDKGHDLPLGPAKLMGSLTEAKQKNVDEAMASRNSELGIDQAKKRKLREGIEDEDIAENADSWWKEAKKERRGIYGDA